MSELDIFLSVVSPEQWFYGENVFWGALTDCGFLAYFTSQHSVAMSALFLAFPYFGRTRYALYSVLPLLTECPDAGTWQFQVIVSLK